MKTVDDLETQLGEVPPNALLVVAHPTRTLYYEATLASIELSTGRTLVTIVPIGEPITWDEAQELDS